MLNLLQSPAWLSPARTRCSLTGISPGKSMSGVTEGLAQVERPRPAPTHLTGPMASRSRKMKSYVAPPE